MLADLLGGGPVGIHDDIFACGATSITVMRLVVLIEQRYDVAIGLSRFIAAPTVAALADLLRAGHAAAPSTRWCRSARAAAGGRCS
ncbi:acyl carrier protein [Streptomyces netropsis]